MEDYFSWRYWLALLVTVTSAWVIWNFTHLILTEPSRSPATPLIHVSLASPPAPPAPPKVVPKPPKPVVAKTVPSRAPVETSPHGMAPIAPANAPTTSANATPSPPTPTSQPPENPALESTYISSVWQAVEQEKRYPQSKDARLQQPSGTVTVWFVLNRSGELQGSGIAQSAGSILDRAALESVRRANYAPFPASIWPGETEHRFQIDLRLHPQ